MINALLYRKLLWILFLPPAAGIVGKFSENPSEKITPDLVDPTLLALIPLVLPFQALPNSLKARGAIVAKR